jgi:hypothetical protein
LSKEFVELLKGEQVTKIIPRKLIKLIIANKFGLFKFNY